MTYIPSGGSSGGVVLSGTPATPKVADQSISAATLTKITGTEVAVGSIAAGTTYRFTFAGSSGAAGTAANTITIRVGTNNSTADGAVASFTTAAGTAAASDFVVSVLWTVRTVGASATASAVATIQNSAAAGFIPSTVAVLPGSMSTFDSTVSGLYVHANVQTGASKTATITAACAEVVA